MPKPTNAATIARNHRRRLRRLRRLQALCRAIETAIQTRHALISAELNPDATPAQIARAQAAHDRATARREHLLKAAAR